MKPQLVLHRRETLKRAEDLKQVGMLISDGKTGFPFVDSCRLIASGVTPFAGFREELIRRIGWENGT